MSDGGADRRTIHGNFPGLSGNLALRAVSSAVILPPLALILYLGGWYFVLLVALVAGAMAWEWTNVACGAAARGTALLAAGVCTLIVAVSPWLELEFLGAALLLAMALVFSCTLVTRNTRPVWSMAGIVIACVPCLSAIALRGGETGSGLLLVCWLIASVAATDTGAYAAGKSIGGPRLAPRISPNKTWAGLIGGMLSSAAVGAVFATLADGAELWTLTATGAAIAVVAQIGDLLESLFKRRFGVKDSGTLIPGHGGVLDRLDGHMTVMTAMAILVMVTGQTPLLW